MPRGLLLGTTNGLVSHGGFAHPLDRLVPMVHYASADVTEACEATPPVPFSTLPGQTKREASFRRLMARPE